MADARSWERQSRYNDRMTRQYPIRLNTKTDADVIARLESLDESKAGYIKRLIREDIAAEGGGRPKGTEYERAIAEWLRENPPARSVACQRQSEALSDAIDWLLAMEQERCCKQAKRGEEEQMERWHVQEYEVEADLFLKTDWTEEDEEKRAYMVRGWLDAFAQRDPKTGKWYVPQSDGWADGIAERKGEVIEELLSAPDAPDGIREWYEEH